jgi:TonB family protein
MLLKGYLSLFIVLLLTTSVFSQKKGNFYTEMLDKKFKPTNDKKEAVYFKYVKKDSLGTYNLKMYRKRRAPYLMGAFWDYECQIPNGLVVSYHHEGTVKDSAWFDKGKLNGVVKGYYAKGTLKRIEHYKNDTLLDFKHISWEGKDTIMQPYQCLPEFEGGKKELSRFIAENLDYPRDAAQRGIQGVVIVGLVVNEDGSVSNVKVLKSPSSLFNYEAEKVVKRTNGKWLPGRKYGEVEEMGITVPVFFILHK